MRSYVGQQPQQLFGKNVVNAPTVTEHDKALVWNNTNNRFEYSAITGGVGGGTTFYSGTTQVDFGSTAGQFLLIAVTGQSNILSTSKVRAWIPARATSDHNIEEHVVVPINVKCGNIVDGTSFTIYLFSELSLTGKFNVDWEWE